MSVAPLHSHMLIQSGFTWFHTWFRLASFGTTFVDSAANKLVSSCQSCNYLILITCFFNYCVKAILWVLAKRAFSLNTIIYSLNTIIINCCLLYVQKKLLKKQKIPFVFALSWQIKLIPILIF